MRFRTGEVVNLLKIYPKYNGSWKFDKMEGEAEVSISGQLVK
jgi:hypothetical protein